MEDEVVSVDDPERIEEETPLIKEDTKVVGDVVEHDKLVGED